MDRAEYVFYKLAQELPKNPKSYVLPGDDKTTTNTGNIYKTNFGLKNKKYTENTNALPDLKNVNYNVNDFSRRAIRYAAENPRDVKEYKGKNFNKIYGRALADGANVFLSNGKLFQNDQAVMNNIDNKGNEYKEQLSYLPFTGKFEDLNTKINTSIKPDLSYRRMELPESRGFNSLPISDALSVGAGVAAANALGKSRTLGFNTTGMTDREMSNLNPFAQAIMNWRQGLEGIPNKWRPNQGESSAFLSTVLGGFPTYFGTKSVLDKIKVGDNLSLKDYLNENAANFFNNIVKGVGLGKWLPKKDEVPQSFIDYQKMIDEKIKNGPIEDARKLEEAGYGDLVNPELRSK